VQQPELAEQAQTLELILTDLWRKEPLIDDLDKELGSRMSNLMRNHIMVIKTKRCLIAQRYNEQMRLKLQLELTLKVLHRQEPTVVCLINRFLNF
jgi:hypothetical protein